MNKEEKIQLKELAKLTKTLLEASCVLRYAHDLFGDADMQTFSYLANDVKAIREAIVSEIIKKLSE